MLPRQTCKKGAKVSFYCGASHPVVIVVISANDASRKVAVTFHSKEKK
jgi:hypothetical protein